MPSKGKRKRDVDEESKADQAEPPQEDEDLDDDAGLDDDDDDVDDDDGLGNESADAHMALLLDSMSDEQRDRYEVFRRSKLLPSEVKRYLSSLGVTPPGKQLLIMLGSVAKIYAGEVVEEALDQMRALNESGAIQPRHLRLAVRALKERGKVPSLEHKPKKLR